MSSYCWIFFSEPGRAGFLSPCRKQGGVPTGIRTPVIAVKGRCPRPLDDGDPDGGVNRQQLLLFLRPGELGQGDAEQQSDETQWYQ